MTARTTEKASPRERLLFAANELFYEEGVHTVGIECGTRPPWLGRAQEEAEEKDMTEISTAGLNHAAFTVSDVERSRAFYSLLGFKEIRPVPNGIITSNGVVILLLRTAPEHATPGDRFDPNRIGLDHFNLSVGSRDEQTNCHAQTGRSTLRSQTYPLKPGRCWWEPWMAPGRGRRCELRR
jgi:catechol 2,3-dioxygenase-like lactoylglutathione lyase family enzyme